MPELPEVETIVSGLRQIVLGKKISAVELRYAGLVIPKNFDIRDLIGDKIISAERHGKYMKLTTKNGLRLVVHLRMTGQLFLTDAKYTPDKHVHLIIKFSDKTVLIYRDIRKFGRWVLVQPQKKFEDYINAGTDALAIELVEFEKLIKKKSKAKLKAFLLDQTNLAGVGNIYADEICFALGLDPETPVGKADPKKLLLKIKEILNLSIKNKGTSVSDYLTSTGAKGNFQNLLKVYKQQICQRCGAKIQRKKVAGRTSHICPACQK